MSRSMLTAFLTGLIFGIGLILSGMVNPAKVLAFLDLAGPWDPSLALVMAGAIAIALPAFQFLKRRTQTVFAEPLHLPTRQDIDGRLILGSLGFGVGWGLAGFCPGPALVAVGALKPEAVVFVVAMLAGMGIFELIERSRKA
ncbi:MAG: YeeE/YedE family protein [Gammaproteobacteria bacterium]|nr:YeeE/YedE family protein [Gammaproteobacteria bacterium]